MVLLIAVLAGLLSGVGRAWITGRAYGVPSLRAPSLVLMGFLPQMAAFYWPVVRGRISDPLASIFLVFSLGTLAVFVGFNRRLPGFWIAGAGLFMNLAVILANGGWMPISPNTVLTLSPNAPAGSWRVGDRLGHTKDVVLPIENTRLWWFSDRWVLPDWIPLQVAFSLGDVLIAVGVFWYLWALGGPQANQSREVS